MSARRPSPAALLAVFLGLLGLVGALVVRERSVDHRRLDERNRAAADVDRLAATLEVAAVSTTRLASDGRAGAGAFAVAAGELVDGTLDAAAMTAGDDQRQLVGSVGDRFVELARGADLGAIAGLDATLDTVAATGEPRLSGPVRLGDVDAVLAVAPVYPAFLADVTERREQLQGFAVGVVRVSSLLEATGDRPLWPDAPFDVRAPGGEQVAGRSVSSPVLDTSFQVADEIWTVRAGLSGSAASPVPYAIALAGFLAGAVGWWAMARQLRGRRRAEKQAVDRARQLELIAQTSADLQQSLDLADLLPAFAVAMAAEFGLDEVRIGVVRDDGGVHEAFRLGDAGRSAGEERTVLHLRRGWRTVGELVVHAAHPLDDVQRQSLQALGDLLAVAMSNAQLYQREQDAVSRLRELDALKNAFLGTVSHELRTSTTAVMGFGEVLADSWDSMPEARRRELAERIRRSAGSLRHLVDDLLDYARLEHQRLRVEPRHISLSALVRQLTDSMSPLVTDHEIDLRVEDGVDAYADPVAVERILANLLSNAGKYSPPGTTITIAVERVGERARLVVSDQGPGIPPAERTRVFVRFYRLDNPATVRTRGAGIGLAILRDFADRSEATVRIDDAPGGGALIEVDFPTQPTGAEPQPDSAPAGTVA